jgi:hypothetical protein
MANWFPMALKDAPRTWLMNVPHESMTSWKDLCCQFIANFMPMYERPATKNDLKAVRQYKGETLRQYIQRLSQMRNKIPRISNEEVISVFSTGVADIKMKEKLSRADFRGQALQDRRQMREGRGGEALCAQPAGGASTKVQVQRPQA